MMAWLYPMTARWLATPLWLLLLAPSALVMLVALIVGGVWISAERQLLLQLDLQHRDSALVVAQWREKITRMPALHPLQRWLADQPPLAADWSSNRVASWLEAPLRDSGVHLVTWRPVQAEGMDTTAPAWLLVFSAEYAATLNFLTRFRALPVVLRIDHLTIRKTPAGLRTELRLSLPQPVEAAR
ncbi:hypothetical protein [Dickeya fangzhongdai]|uniref:hypothetical protein n=1 Tax=Dickeya fangzhongdai TaxID=1778540 RepID=UPI0026DF3447|nr:hypothetical protein [Dickeya fangzhongdai]WKV49366.1 hypothetical protein PL145_15575 [Dickeya fangzhongdai]